MHHPKQHVVCLHHFDWAISDVLSRIQTAAADSKVLHEMEKRNNNAKEV
jgi:hypothetical protein